MWVLYLAFSDKKTYSNITKLMCPMSLNYFISELTWKAMMLHTRKYSDSYWSLWVVMCLHLKQFVAMTSCINIRCAVNKWNKSEGAQSHSRQCVVFNWFTMQHVISSHTFISYSFVLDLMIGWCIACMHAIIISYLTSYIFWPARIDKFLLKINFDVCLKPFH